MGLEILNFTNLYSNNIIFCYEEKTLSLWKTIVCPYLTGLQTYELFSHTFIKKGQCLNLKTEMSSVCKLKKSVEQTQSFIKH